MMNTIKPDLKFTPEFPEYFPDQKVPTLDTKVWMESNWGPTSSYRFLFEFYSKTMSSEYCEPEPTARAWSTKLSSLSQEVYRRLLYTSPDLPPHLPSQSSTCSPRSSFTLATQETCPDRSSCQEHRPVLPGV